MGLSIIDMVVQRLQGAGFQADVAFPGQKYPVISKPVAAVHIDQVDRANRTVTLEVTVICPGAMGGAQCELEALRATEILRQSSAVCVQNGCTYDGIAQVYCVDVFATYTGVTEEDDYRIGLGFKVYVDDIIVPDTVRFTAERYADCGLQFSMGEASPTGSSAGSGGWRIILEEQIPTGEYEFGEGYEPMTIRLEKSTGVHEVFSGCRWTSVKREFTKEGTHRVRTGIAVAMEEVIDV